MIIEVGNTNDAQEVVNKTFNVVKELNGFLRENCDILNPVITIQTSNPTSYNYCYIPSFGRYYYITNFTSLKNNIWEIHLKIDVLKTYANDIKNHSAIIERQSYKYNVYQNDNEFISLNYKKIVTKEFPTGFTKNGSIVLTVSGGD